MLVVDPDPEATRTFNENVEKLLAQVPALNEVGFAETRRARLEGRGTFGPIEVVAEGVNSTIAGRAGDIPIRTFVPPEVNGAYLHIHGGGWCLGSSEQQDVALWAMARRAKAAVVSVDYRLAPEDPYPAGPDDCEDAALWFVKHAANEWGVERLAIGGESAGAHLAAVTLLRLRDRHGLTPFAGANLTYGAYDLTMTPTQWNWGDRNLILSTPIMAAFYDAFLPGMSQADRRDPDVSPLYADFAGLCPALFTVGTQDPLLDDSLFMAARWEAAGNATELLTFPEGIHGFNAFPLPLGALANEHRERFVTGVLAS